MAQIIGTSNNEKLLGTMFEDVIEAGDGDDILVGRQGNDSLVGGEGSDTFFGGRGADIYSGGEGADKFWLARGKLPQAVNTITDFETETDVLALAGVAEVNQFADLSLVQMGKDTRIRAAGQDLAILQGIRATTLSKNDFRFETPEDPHFLAPLTAEEITTAVDVVKEEKELSDAVLFPSITLKEPVKAEVANFYPNSPLSREALIVVLEREQNRVFEAVIDLDRESLVSWEEIPGVQPGITDPVEFDLLDEAVRNDPRWQQAMRDRGITNLDEVIIDGWAPGLLSEEEIASGARLLRGLSYLPTDDENFYAHPIEGVLATVNLNTGEVIDFIDTGAVPINTENAGLSEELIGDVQEPLPPLEINQPQGRGFEIEGNHLTWENWDLRYSMDPRTGLVLHQVNYNDNGELRPILYRGSLSEMAVPYAETDPNWNFRVAFDVGEYYLGRLTNNMELGREVPENAVLLDAVFADDFGEPYLWENSLGIYERDGGLLWQHYDYAADTIEGRRGTELVLTHVMTIGNYDYAIDWIFGQDGSIEVETHLTGVLLLKGTDATNVEELDESDRYGNLVDTNLLAPLHQHFFNFRLDLDVNGVENSITEHSIVQVPIGPSNPSGIAFEEEETLLATELAARRNINLEQHRGWSVIDANEENALGGEIGYTLEPDHNTVPYADESSDLRQRAGFVNNHVWVTQYDPKELYAAGDYPNQGELGQGLPEYVSDDESLVGEDIVLWYTLGVTHPPRPEDYPVMPVETASFQLIPEGFFTENPALDVPSSIG